MLGRRLFFSFFAKRLTNYLSIVKGEGTVQKSKNTIFHVLSPLNGKEHVKRKRKALHTKWIQMSKKVFYSPKSIMGLDS